MNLDEATKAYINLRQSLGAVFASDRRVLRAFVKAMGDVPVIALEPEACRSFCRGDGLPTRWWERKHSALAGFFTFLVSRGHLSNSPLPQPWPRIPRSFEAYIYSLEEIQSLLDATTNLSNPRCPLQGATCRTLLLLLYGAGLRPSEGLHLRCCDVDLGSRVLAIWDTKFFKSRMVPIGTDLNAALRAHASRRQYLPMLDGVRSPFFASPKGAPISLETLEKVFRKLRKDAGVNRPEGSRWQPRLHDLRHGFAVHRLVAWYREGADVQACLPLLATYLGHVNIAGTQTYLSMTPDLLAEASKRFEGYALPDEWAERHG
jgi:site-specific recombinase XerD